MRTYTTIQGDTWDMISYKMYRDEYQLDKLIEANTDYISVAIFSAGTVLNIPEIEPTSNVGKPPWMR